MTGDLEGWHFSWHALSRACDMCLTPEELTECLQRPKIRRPCPPPHGSEYELWSNGHIALAVHRENRRVITVLWYTPERRYERDLEEDLKRIRDPQ